MAKVTFTLDDQSVQTIRRLAERAKKPQSLVVREAVAHYAAREEKLTPDEQARLRSVIDDMRTMSPTRPQREVGAELRAARGARRAGWHRPSDR